MSAFLLLLALIGFGTAIAPALRHDAELPISHTGKARK